MLSMRFNIIIPKRVLGALQQNENQISRETMETLLDDEIVAFSTCSTLITHSQVLSCVYQNTKNVLCSTNSSVQVQFVSYCIFRLCHK